MRAVSYATALILLSFSFADAVTRHVPSEYPTIQEAIDASLAGDVVLVAPGVYSEVVERPGANACVVLKRGVIVTSEGGPAVTTIDRMGDDRPGTSVVVYGGFLIGPGTVLEGFTITGAAPGDHGMFLDQATGGVTIRDCVFEGLPSVGAYLRWSKVRFEDCVFPNAQDRAIYTQGADLEIERCTFEGAIRGAVRCDGADHDPQGLTVRNSVFRNNTATSGAAVAARDCYPDLLIEGCLFEHNVAELGGAIDAGGSGFKTIRDNLFVDNRAESQVFGQGGAMRVSEHLLTITGNTIVGSYQQNPDGGAAVLIIGHTPGSSFHDNVIAGSTGAPAVFLFSGWWEHPCNVYWNNAEGDVAGFSLDPTDQIADPLFCDPPSGNYTVSAASPCLPQNNPNCLDLIGAFGLGCGAISVEPMSWGRLKAMYHPNEE